MLLHLLNQSPNQKKIFNNNDLPSDLTGSLEASVSFAQSQIMPTKHGIEGDVQPYLTALRTSLIMVKPKRSDLNGLCCVIRGN